MKALFQGGADSKSNDTGIVSEYKGEFKTIIFEKAIINGKETSVFLYPGDGITNAYFAFLRAYGAFDAFRSILKDTGVPVSEFKVQLIANEYEPQGRRYRFGQVTIAIRKDITPKRISEVIHA